ncbi:MAG: hypothetical protein Unbinned3907contig1000_10 [Prokaryotic dsDNA virus sp.]|nr:MAG: hypothetical protein Unbinned3907contig1000_10 [Prokaryotic dsDNA virus sp.]|tara:strand:- start:4677 stop:5177 length:501 start_codon:yes stop_codon:yes gene_type:complete
MSYKSVLNRLYQKDEVELKAEQVNLNMLNDLKNLGAKLDALYTQAVDLNAEMEASQEAVIFGDLSLGKLIAENREEEKDRRKQLQSTYKKHQSIASSSEKVMNQGYDVWEKLDVLLADFEDAYKAVGLDPRQNKDFMRPNSMMNEFGGELDDLRKKLSRDVEPDNL